MKRLLAVLLFLILPSLMMAQIPIKSLKSDTLRVNVVYKGTGIPTPSDSNKVPTGYGTWAYTIDVDTGGTSVLSTNNTPYYDPSDKTIKFRTTIRTLPFKDGFDSSAIAVGVIRNLGVGNNEVVDTAFVMLRGTSADISFNIYSGTTLGTATDSLFTANWNATGTNAVVTKVTANMRNSGSLGYKYWWLKVTAITTKPLDIVFQFKGH